MRVKPKLKAFLVELVAEGSAVDSARVEAHDWSEARVHVAKILGGRRVRLGGRGIESLAVVWPTDPLDRAIRCSDVTS